MGKDLKGKELGKGISQRADGRYIARFTSKTGKRKTQLNNSHHTTFVRICYNTTFKQTISTCFHSFFCLTLLKFQ